MKTLIIKVVKNETEADIYFDWDKHFTNLEIITILEKTREALINQMNDGSFRDIKEVVENVRS